jgi:uncharacterized protein (TIGR01777 family)
MPKRIIITGATGLIGSKLTNALVAKNYKVTIFTRNVDKAKTGVPSAADYLEWNYRNPGQWQNRFEDSYAVIHLAGANLAGKRFTESYKKKIWDSRIISTKNIVKAISETNNRPAIFICASGINYYGDSNERILNEDLSSGNDFLAKLCEEWENEAAKVEEKGVRRVSVRTSPVLSIHDGMLKKLYPLFKLYLGASLGSGNQWFSWIHIDDIINAYIYALENNAVSGAVNASAPNPVIMDEFAREFGSSLNRPVFFRVPLFVLKAILGEAGDSLTASLRVIPEKLQNSGFSFKYPDLHEAFIDIVRNKK